MFREDAHQPCMRLITFMVAHLALHVLSPGLNAHELTFQVVPRNSPPCYSPLDIIHCCLFQWAAMKKSEVNQ